MEKYELIDNMELGRYEYRIDGYDPHVYYKVMGNTVHLSQAYVPHEMRGRGIASLLIEDVLADIRDKGLKVIPRCSFVAQYIDDNPKWHHILAR